MFDSKETIFLNQVQQDWFLVSHIYKTFVNQLKIKVQTSLSHFPWTFSSPRSTTINKTEKKNFYFTLNKKRELYFLAHNRIWVSIMSDVPFASSLTTTISSFLSALYGRKWIIDCKTSDDSFAIWLCNLLLVGRSKCGEKK